MLFRSRLLKLSVSILIFFINFNSSAQSCRDVLTNLDYLTLDKLPSEPDFVPFQIVDHEALKIRVETALAKVEESIAAIKNHSGEPDFFNTVKAMEDTQRWHIYTRLLGHYFYVKRSPEIEALLQASTERQQQIYHAFYTDPAIYQRFKAVSTMGLDKQEARLLKIYQDAFEQEGVHLKQAKKDELIQLKQEQEKLGIEYTKNIDQYIEANAIRITKSRELIGIPSSIKKSLLIENAGQKEYLIPLDSALTFSVLRYAKNRNLRKEIYKRLRNQAPRNAEIAIRMGEIKSRIAEIQGFSNYLSMRAKNDFMVKSADQIEGFINNLTSVYKPRAPLELEFLRSFAEDNLGLKKLEGWDIPFVINEYKRQHLNIDSEYYRDYFELNRVWQGLLDLSYKLFKIRLVERSDLPTYLPEVKVFEVLDDAENKSIGFLFLDLYVRGGTKQQGAWMYELKSRHEKPDGLQQKASVVLAADFASPPKDEPQRLYLEEVLTLFHEFGHALHGLISEARYPALSGVRTALDFVELPSQFMENFVFEPEILKSFAFHYRTGQSLPADDIKRFLNARNFLSSMHGLSDLSLDKLDLVWHSDPPPRGTDLEQWENKVLADYRLLKSEGVLSNAFNHIFSGGYDGGYYSYKWAQVLDADAFSLFKEDGDLFNQEVAQRYKEHILKRSSSQDPMEAYRNFSGRDPDIRAFLKRQGIELNDEKGLDP